MEEAIVPFFSPPLPRPNHLEVPVREHLHHVLGGAIVAYRELLAGLFAFGRRSSGTRGSSPQSIASVSREAWPPLSLFLTTKVTNFLTGR